MGLNKHLISAGGVAVSSVFASESLSIFQPELIAPQTDGFLTDRDTSVFDVTVTRWRRLNRCYSHSAVWMISGRNMWHLTILIEVHPKFCRM
jgi:hypothetical protein